MIWPLPLPGNLPPSYRQGKISWNTARCTLKKQASSPVLLQKQDRWSALDSQL
jgi:hypothetical protein